MSLAGKVAMVTGAAQGIGLATSLKLAQEGADIAMVDLNGPRVKEAAGQLGALGRKALAIEANITNAAQVEALVKQALDAFGHVDILVNNAGIARDRLLLRMTEEDWDAVLSVNLKGAYLCTRALLPSMLRQRWGRIISMSSVVGIAGNPGQANYAASKAGLIGFTKSVAREVASRNITVNAIAPGFISTDMTTKLSKEIQDRILARIAMQRFGTPQDVANLVAFLASEEAAYITAQVIGIDGGIGL